MPTPRRDTEFGKAVNHLTRRATRALCAALLVRPVMDWTRERELPMRYMFIGAMRHEIVSASDDLALRQAMYVTGNANVRLYRRAADGSHWERVA